MEKNQEEIIARVHDFQATFETEHGKRVLKQLMKNTGFLHTNFVNNDPYGTAYNEGARSIVLHILNMLKIDVNKLEKQLSEEQYE